jgi:hypothetical protein
MPKRANCFVLAGLVAAVPVTTLPGRAAPAAECLSAPNHQPSEGGHWYYRVNRATHGKCWYLARRGVASAPAAPENPPAPGSPMRLLESLGNAAAGPAAKDQALGPNNDALRPQTRTPEPRAVQSTPAPAGSPRPDRAPSPGPSTREELFRAFQRWQEKRKEQAEREELFEEFTRWQEQQRQRQPTTSTVASEKANPQ